MVLSGKLVDDIGQRPGIAHIAREDHIGNAAGRAGNGFPQRYDAGEQGAASIGAGDAQPAGRHIAGGDAAL